MERGMIFVGSMIPGLLDGSKTMTRRPIKGHKLRMIKFDALKNPENKCPSDTQENRAKIATVQKLYAEIKSLLGSLERPDLSEFVKAAK